MKVRNSSRPHDYTQGLHLAQVDPAHREAASLSVHRGFLSPDTDLDDRPPHFVDQDTADP